MSCGGRVREGAAFSALWGSGGGSHFRGAGRGVSLSGNLQPAPAPKHASAPERLKVHCSLGKQKEAAEPHHLVQHRRLVLWRDRSCILAKARRGNVLRPSGKHDAQVRQQLGRQRRCALQLEGLREGGGRVGRGGWELSELWQLGNKHPKPQQSSSRMHLYCSAVSSTATAVDQPAPPPHAVPAAC